MQHNPLFNIFLPTLLCVFFQVLKEHQTDHQMDMLLPAFCFRAWSPHEWVQGINIFSRKETAYFTDETEFSHFSCFHIFVRISSPRSAKRLGIRVYCWRNKSSLSNHGMTDLVPTKLRRFITFIAHICFSVCWMRDKRMCTLRLMRYCVRVGLTRHDDPTVTFKIDKNENSCNFFPIRSARRNLASLHNVSVPRTWQKWGRVHNITQTLLWRCECLHLIQSCTMPFICLPYNQLQSI